MHRNSATLERIKNDVFRKEKLKKQFLQNAKIEKDIFNCQTFWINGRTKPPAHELEVLLGRFGGIRNQGHRDHFDRCPNNISDSPWNPDRDYVLTTKTDFQIVDNLPRAKRIKLRDYDKVGFKARGSASAFLTKIFFFYFR